MKLLILYIIGGGVIKHITKQSSAWSSSTHDSLPHSPSQHFTSVPGPCPQGQGGSTESRAQLCPVPPPRIRSTFLAQACNQQSFAHRLHSCCQRCCGHSQPKQRCFEFKDWQVWIKSFYYPQHSQQLSPGLIYTWQEGIFNWQHLILICQGLRMSVSFYLTSPSCSSSSCFPSCLIPPVGGWESSKREERHFRVEDGRARAAGRPPPAALRRNFPYIKHCLQSGFGCP